MADLLSVEVTSIEGRQLGRVHDVRLAGAADPSSGLTVQGLVVGAGALGARLGYLRPGTVRGPWLLDALFGALSRSARYVRWEDVVEFDTDGIRVRGGGDPVPPLARHDDRSAK